MEGLTTYAGWVKALEKFSTGDDTVIFLMESGSFVLDAGVAQRFYTSVEKVYRLRKEQWLNKLNQNLQAQSVGPVRELVLTVDNAKTNLRPLIRFAQARGLPAELRLVLEKDLLAFVAEVKESLIKNIPKGHPHREAMLLTLQNFNLPHNYGMVSESQPVQSRTVPVSTSLPGRKIIF